MEKQAQWATRQEVRKDVERTSQLLQIFAKTLQLLEVGNGRMASDLTNIEAHSQVQ
jgi:hypothetical protein